MKNHPDYDPETECGEVTLTREQALCLALAAAEALRHTKMPGPREFLRAAVEALDDVFDLGIAPRP